MSLANADSSSARHQQQADMRLVPGGTFRMGSPKACCIPENPRGGIEAGSYDTCQPQIRIPRKVVKGGSHLCAPNYCRRYRPAGRHPQPADTSMSHVCAVLNSAIWKRGCIVSSWARRRRSSGGWDR
jgi:formylglycine-generating enzyme required for sulfatase activity